ncbi:MAG: hypothetical protein SFV15_03825 [Polyangiaceae bacterium]|nr:hypothetical protein [Polyangiaceae bacterium]
MSQSPGVRVDVDKVETNIVNVGVAPGLAPAISAWARELGLLINPIHLSTLRAVTHLDVGLAATLIAAERLAAVVAEFTRRQTAST